MSGAGRGAPRPWGPAAAVAGIVLAYAAVAALQILVWNPLAAAPGLTLPEIRAELAVYGEAIHGVPVLVILGLGVALAVGLMGWMLSWRAGPGQVLAVGLLLIAGGAPAYVAASFNVGMSLADGLGISGGDHAPWGMVLMGFSLVALLLVVLLGVDAVLRDRDRRRRDGGRGPRVPAGGRDGGG
jgi:hypothetical protein